MPLRRDLVVPPPRADFVEKLRTLAERAVDAFWPNPHSCDPSAIAAVQEIQALTGNASYDTFYFHSLIGWGSPSDFANRAALGMPPCVIDLAREEIIDLIERVTAVCEPYSSYYLDLLINSFPYASISDLIYWPDRERSASEIVDEILLRKDLFETGGSDAVLLHVASLGNAIG